MPRPADSLPPSANLTLQQSGEIAASRATSNPPRQSLCDQLRPLLESLPASEDGIEAPDHREPQPDPSILSWLHRVTGPSPRTLRRWPKSLIGRAWQSVSSAGGHALIEIVRLAKGNKTDAWANSWLESGRWPTRPLRIGVLDQDLRQDLESAPGSCATRWIRLKATHTPRELCRRHTLDALVHADVCGVLHVVMPETRQRAAAWHDWSTARPITFSALFPGRVDCAELTLPSEAGRPGGIALLRSLIEAAAVFARHPSRLSMEDRLQGRLPIVDTTRGLALPPTGHAPRDARRLVVHRLAEMLQGPATSAHSSTARVAARVVSAFATGVDEDLPEIARLEMVEACAKVASDEPEVLLRLAASQIAGYADVAALETLLRGERLLRGHELNAGTSQLPFLQAELEVGHGATISLGRVASGVAMVCASLETKHLPHFRDDLLDDARFSDWLIPKEQDRRLLMEVFRGIIAEREIALAQRIAA